MDEIVNMNNTNSMQKVNSENDLVGITEGLLMDARISINNNKVLSVPIAELSTLGAGVSSLIPTFNTVTQMTSIATDGLFRVANAAAGDTLKIAKNGNVWGVMKTATGNSKKERIYLLV